MNETTTPSYRIRTIEAGYARVTNATDHTIGYVERDDRTRFWRALSPGGRSFGSRATRGEAARLVADRRAEWEADR